MVYVAISHIMTSLSLFISKYFLDRSRGKEKHLIQSTPDFLWHHEDLSGWFVKTTDPSEAIAAIEATDKLDEIFYIANKGRV